MCETCALGFVHGQVKKKMGGWLMNIGSYLTWADLSKWTMVPWRAQLQQWRDGLEDLTICGMSKESEFGWLHAWQTCRDFLEVSNSLDMRWAGHNDIRKWQRLPQHKWSEWSLKENFILRGYHNNTRQGSLPWRVVAWKSQIANGRGSIQLGGVRLCRWLDGWTDHPTYPIVGRPSAQRHGKGVRLEEHSNLFLQHLLVVEELLDVVGRSQREVWSYLGCFGLDSMVNAWKKWLC
jgi:hypothetical protein